uniref:Non-haem dioxygenase N-terminal domain-containing protein n=1 Tax=Ananas comosus var. bracteatus TaxID=296719 RepID=A0A6V7QY48_ANACO
MLVRPVLFSPAPTALALLWRNSLLHNRTLSPYLFNQRGRQRPCRNYDGEALRLRGGAGPRIDFRGLELARPSSPEWAAARSEAAAALRRLGCFEAVYGGVGADLKGPLMARAAPELFALPLGAKTRNASDHPFLGYIGNIPGMAYESLRVADAPDLHSVDKFARLLWPQGNPSFCNIVWTYAKRMQELEQMVERMILESLGLEKYFQSHIESLEYAVRLSEYGVPLDRETKIAMQSHVDPT